MHEGPPFKFSKSHTKHTNFVNCVRYSPDGLHAARASVHTDNCAHQLHPLCCDGKAPTNEQCGCKYGVLSFSTEVKRHLR
eukprot:540443-Amphidinium_carterae.1